MLVAFFPGQVNATLGKPEVFEDGRLLLLGCEFIMVAFRSAKVANDNALLRIGSDFLGCRRKVAGTLRVP